jgi:hypothetical protein
VALAVIVLSLVGVAVIVAVVISLFVRRHGESDRPQSGWVPTDELFKDPGTDRMMRVWKDRTGERHYVPEQHG